MGSNSSVIQQSTLNQLNVVATGEAVGTGSTVCVITGANILSHGCNVHVGNTCTNSTEVTSNLVLEASISSTQNATTEQNASMWAFLDFNSSTNSQTIENILNANVGNSCKAMGTVESVVSNLQIYVTKRPCIRSIKVYNHAANEVTCTLNTTMNLFSNADITASVTQKSGGLGSSDGDGCIQVFFILLVIFIFLSIAVLFVFKRRKHQHND